MSLQPPATATPGNSAEQNASSSSAPAVSSGSNKLRSCVVCRSRKVRCDKLSPCTNCRRANIPCVVPSNDRPPKWARRLERITNNAAAPGSTTTTTTSNATVAQSGNDAGVNQVMDRLRNLEGLVKELSGQLEQAHAAASPNAGHDGGPSSVNSPGSQDGAASTSSNISSSGMQKHFGRLVLQDKNKTRYINSGFWSRVSDELDGLKMDTKRLAPDDDSDSSDDDSPYGRTPSTQELDRTPSERHSFLFGHNLSSSGSDMRQYRPLPSQIPFLLTTYSENVNLFLQAVHMPTVTKLVRDLRGTDWSGISPANEALLFSIYYAAITSMEDEDVMTNFGSSKADLNIKYRVGLEHALARADFLNNPDFVLVQAFTVFIALVRRHDSPRFVWMMMGILIRMAQSIGLQRDGSHFDHLQPYEVEMRRRVWWAICMLDMRAAEDQGVEYSILPGSFDTNLPMNLNDSDIDPDINELPQERQGATDLTFALATYEMCGHVQAIMREPILEKQGRLLNELYETLERKHLQHVMTKGNNAYWVGATALRLVISKLTLFIYLPALFSSPNHHFSDDIRNKLLIAALEVAEYNHEVNAEQDCRQWRWIYQTYTHWHAIVYLLIEVTRRPLSPLVERAWVALHSPWLIPHHQPNSDSNTRIWVPLKKLMAKARKHREAEIQRLRRDPEALQRLEMQDAQNPAPASSGPFPEERCKEMFVHHWRTLIESADEPMPQEQQHLDLLPTSVAQQQSANSPSFLPTYDVNLQPPFLGQDTNPQVQPDVASSFPLSQPDPTLVAGWLQGDADIMTSGVAPWLWADAPGSSAASDVYNATGGEMDVDADVDWNDWLQSATGTEVNTGNISRGNWPMPPMPER